MAKKSLIIAALAAFLSMGTLFSAYGQEKAITSIPLTFSWDTAPKGGELVGNVYAVSSTSEFKVEGAVYDKKDDQWDYGERPVVEVELSAKDGYYFSSTKRSIFSLTGCGAQFKTAEKDGDGSALILQVYLPAIDGNLYRDKKLVTTQKTSESTYDFSSYINVEGNYTFTVRALGTYSSQAGPWTDNSEPLTIRTEDTWFITNGKWDKTSSGWRYVYPNNVYPVNSWRCISDNWYYFGQNGYMESDCYVKSSDQDLYYWLGSDGIWNTEKDTAAPESGARVVK